MSNFREISFIRQIEIDVWEIGWKVLNRKLWQKVSKDQFSPFRKLKSVKGWEGWDEKLREKQQIEQIIFDLRQKFNVFLFDLNVLFKQ